MVGTHGRGFACLCCGYLTLPEEPPGTFFICPVCRWEDEFEGSLPGGANRVSLRQAQANYRRFSTSDPDRRRDVRPPRPQER
jgi:hypothetical protein